MDYQIDSETKSDILRVALQPDDELKVRTKSVMSKAGGVRTHVSTTRSVWKAIGTSTNFPMTTVKAVDKRGVVTLVPPLPGEIRSVTPNQDTLLVESLAFVGASSSYDFDLKTNELFDNETLGTLFIEDSDEPIFISGLGGITTIELGEGQQTLVTEDYLLALDGTIEYTKKGQGGFKEKALGANPAPVVKLIGPGTVYLHARSPFQVIGTLSKLKQYDS